MYKQKPQIFGSFSPLPHNLNYFIECVESESITDAAKRSYISQPALTAAIKKLEEEFGSSLLIRSKKGVKPTSEGLQLYRYAKKCRAGYQDVLRNMENPVPSVKIGVVGPFYFKYVRPQINAGALESSQFFLRYSYEILNAVEDSKLDFGIIGWTDEPNVRRLIPLRKIPCGVVGLREKYSHIEQVHRYEDLMKETWIRLPKPQHDWTKALETEAELGFIADSPATAKDLILSGAGISDREIDVFTPEEIGKLSFCPAGSRYPNLHYYLVYGKNLAPHSKAILDRYVALFKT